MVIAVVTPEIRTEDEDELEDELPQNSSGSAPPEAQKRPILSGFSASGAEGGRTPDLLIANEERQPPCDWPIAACLVQPTPCRQCCSEIPNQSLE